MLLALQFPERFYASSTLSLPTWVEKSKSIAKLIGQLCPCYVVVNCSALFMGIGQGSLQTLFKDAKKLCWPDGFSFGHGGVLYLTDSALQDVMMKSARQIKNARPYYIYRFHPGSRAVPGH